MTKEIFPKNLLEKSGVKSENKENSLYLNLSVGDENQAKKIEQIIEENFSKTESAKNIILDIKGESGIITEKLKSCSEYPRFIETFGLLHKEKENSEPLDFLKKYIPAGVRLFDVDYNFNLCDYEILKKRGLGIPIFSVHPAIKDVFEIDDFDSEIEGPVILYSRKDLSKIDGPISLLHEIYHTKQENLLAIGDNLYKSIVEYWNKSYNENRKEPNENEILIKLDWETPDAPSALVPLDLWKQWINLRSKIERDAWAFALKILSKERKNNNDLAPGLTKEKLDKLLHEEECKALASYELGIQKQQVIPEEKKIKGKFSKKTGKI